MTTVTKAVHEARLAKLREWLGKRTEERRQKFADDPRALYDVETNAMARARTLRLEFYIDRLDSIVESDRDADLVWSGAAYGYALALYNLDAHAKASTPRRRSTENLKRKQRPAVTAAQADAALRKHGNNISAAARALGVNRKTIERRRTK
jgi:DNA-binding NtrC family response regulator